ncbi:MAG: DUF932 domain-containing protein [Halothiobacillaceae bacterium]
MSVNQQWATRPADQRFLSLPELAREMHRSREASRASVESSRRVRAVADESDPRRGLLLETPHGQTGVTHFAFGQLAQLAAAPGGYLRTLPAAMAADCINYGLRFSRAAEDVGLLTTRIGTPDGLEAAELRAATGPRYGRIWNADVIDSLMDRFGDGRTGRFRVPGEFGREVPITRQNTTLYGSDRDMFVFLADEENRIEIQDRRDGKGGSLARGFIVSNSEVGASSLSVTMFLFDYVCANRIVWGVQGKREIRLRHTAAAPDRWAEEVAPVLLAYGDDSAEPIEAKIAAAQAAKIDSDLDAFLSARQFSKAEVAGMKAAHMEEEGRPIETLWDVTTGATAYAKGIQWQDERVALERKAGAVLDLAPV